MKKELVSVVIVNWNGKKWLKGILGSLAKQTYKKIEVIVVDNNSNDGSIEYIKRYFPKTIVIKNKSNVGFPTANNIGVKKSKGKYLLLVNNDVWFEKTFVSDLLAYYFKSKLDVVSPIEKQYNKTSGGMSNYTIDITGSPAYFKPFYQKNKLFFTSVCYLLEKKFYLNTGGFDEQHFAYYEDVDWFWRMTLLNKKFGYADGVPIYHAGAGSIGKGMKHSMFLYRNQNALQTLLKNYSVLSLIFVMPLYIAQNIIEIFFFLFIGKFDLSYSYLQGWYFNIYNLKKILRKRAWIQKRRKVSDWIVLKKMYIGPAKLKMLIDYYAK